MGSLFFFLLVFFSPIYFFPFSLGYYSSMYFLYLCFVFCTNFSHFLLRMNKGDINYVEPTSIAINPANTNGIYAEPIIAIEQSCIANIYEEPYNTLLKVIRTNGVFEEENVDIQQSSTAHHYQNLNIAMHQVTTINDDCEEATGAIQQPSKPNVYEEPNIATQQASKKNNYNYVESNDSIGHAHKQSVHVISLHVLITHNNKTCSTFTLGDGRNSQGQLFLPHTQQSVTVYSL